MKKLKLQVDQLAVESFPVCQVEEEIGTVKGEMAPTPPYVGCPGKTRMTYDCPCTPMV
ncbi:MAG TPA: hypothetical protein VFT45_19790 [Longimicrobium sp.]|nr:hypothetical protein [Longimicrobium sp.]